MGSIVGSVVGSVASGLVGKALGGGKSKSAPTGSSQTQVDPRGTFKPVTLTTGTGTAKLTGGDEGVTGSFDLDPRLAALQNLGFDTSGGLLEKYLSGLNAFQPRELGMSWNPEQATQQNQDHQQ